MHTVVRAGPHLLGAKRAFWEDFPETMLLVSAKLDQQQSLCVTVTNDNAHEVPNVKGTAG